MMQGLILGTADGDRVARVGWGAAGGRPGVTERAGILRKPYSRHKPCSGFYKVYRPSIRLL